MILTTPSTMDKRALDCIVPVELRDRPQWVRHRGKQPYQANGGAHASSTNPATWASFDDAMADLNGFDGVGFVFSADNGITGVDLDACIDETGTIAPEAQTIIDKLASYAEVSPSGRGVHIFVKAELNGRGRKLTPKDFKLIELYDRGRYFTVTGNHVEGTPLTIETRQAELDEILEQYTPKVPTRPAPPTNGQSRLHGSTDALDRCLRYIEKLPPAISGQGGHDRTFNAACECYRFGLDDTQARQVLEDYNARCEPPWSDRDLDHKLESARERVQTDGEIGIRLRERATTNPAHSTGLRTRMRTDLGNAERLRDQFGPTLRWTRGQGWLVFDGARWASDATGEVHRHAAHTVRGMYREAEGLEPDARKTLVAHAVKSEGASRLRAMVDIARHLNGIAIEDEMLDRDPWLFNVANGTIEVSPESGQYRHREHRAGDLITRASPVQYSADATCPAFESFLKEIFQDDADLIAFARRALGSCIVGVPEEVLHVWHGSGANGKTTLVNVIVHVLGDYVATLPQKFLATRRGDTIPHELMDLRGARLGITSEPDDAMRLDEALVKYLTGRDEIKARRLYHDLVAFQPTHKLILVTNHKPDVPSQTEAIWRRLTLWPFTYTIPEQSRDRTFPEKLKTEASGILNWLLAGCTEWVRCDLYSNPPSAVRAATDAYRRAEDEIADWLEEWTEPGGETAFRFLWESYREWTRDCPRVSRKRLGMILQERGYRANVKRGQRIYVGIRIRLNPDSEA